MAFVVDVNTVDSNEETVETKEKTKISNNRKQPNPLAECAKSIQLFFF